MSFSTMLWLNTRFCLAAGWAVTWLDSQLASACSTYLSYPQVRVIACKNVEFGKKKKKKKMHVNV